MYSFSSAPKPPIDYVSKENRSEKVTYAGIGQTTYGSGFPPSLYDNAITAVTSYPVVYAVISAISEAVAGLGIKVFQVDGGQEVEVTDHPFYMMFANPNPYQGSFEFLEQVQQELDVTGNAFIAKEKVGSGVEFYLLNSRYIAILPDPKIKIKAYRYYINGQSIDYKPEEVIHIKYNNVDDPYFGMPPLSTATDIISFEKNRLKFINQYFKNGAIPVGVLETEQVLGETLLKKLRNEWTAIHGGVSNSHKVGILQGGLKYSPITSPIKELDFPSLKKLSKDDILSIFKVPESILGSQEGTGAKEGKDAITAFWRQCIIPRLKGLSRGLTAASK
jgi:HK97 family phage portal protein